MLEEVQDLPDRPSGCILGVPWELDVRPRSTWSNDVIVFAAELLDFHSSDTNSPHTRDTLRRHEVVVAPDFHGLDCSRVIATSWVPTGATGHRLGTYGTDGIPLAGYPNHVRYILRRSVAHRIMRRVLDRDALVPPIELAAQPESRLTLTRLSKDVKRWGLHTRLLLPRGFKGGMIAITSSASV